MKWPINGARSNNHIITSLLQQRKCVPEGCSEKAKVAATALMYVWHLIYMEMAVNAALFENDGIGFNLRKACMYEIGGEISGVVERH